MEAAGLLCRSRVYNILHLLQSPCVKCLHTCCHHPNPLQQQPRLNHHNTSTAVIASCFMVVTCTVHSFITMIPVCCGQVCGSNIPIHVISLQMNALPYNQVRNGFTLFLFSSPSILFVLWMQQFNC